MHAEGTMSLDHLDRASTIEAGTRLPEARYPEPESAVLPETLSIGYS